MPACPRSPTRHQRAQIHFRHSRERILGRCVIAMGAAIQRSVTGNEIRAG